MNKEGIIVYENEPVGIGSTIFRGLHRLYYKKPNEILYFQFVNPLYSTNNLNTWSAYLHQPFEGEKQFLLTAQQNKKLKEERGVFNNLNQPLLFGYGKAQNNGSLFSDSATVKGYREFAKPFLKFKKNIIDKVNSFKLQHFTDNKILSIHKRGTDQFTSRGHAGKSAHLFSNQNITDKVDKIQKNYDRIFVATDEQCFLDLMQERYGNKVCSYSTIRANANETIGLHFQFSQANSETKYLIGEEAIIDSILMSQSNFAFYMRSNISLLSILLRSNFDYEFVDNHIDYGDMG